MSEFECPECGSGNLYQVRTETVSQRMEPNFSCDFFDCGKEEVIDCQESALQCGEGHVLTLKDGAEVNDFKDYKKWLAEQVS